MEAKKNKTCFTCQSVFSRLYGWLEWACDVDQTF